MTDIYVLEKRATKQRAASFYCEASDSFVPMPREATKYPAPVMLYAIIHRLVKSPRHTDCTPESLVGKCLSQYPIREPDNR